MHKLLPSVALLSVFGMYLASFSTGSAVAAPPANQCHGQVTICHATSSETNPYNKLTISCNAVYGANGNAGHFDENGTPLAGHEEDVFADEHGLCPGESVEVTPTPSPEPFPSESPTPEESPAPSPTIIANLPSPTPSSSPTSEEPGRQTALATDHLVCDLTYFDVIMDVKDHGTPVENVLVRFTYAGTTLEARTNSGGRAKVTFTRNGNGTLSAQAEGYPSQSLSITMPLTCDPIVLDPDRSSSRASTSSGRGGQVLGMTTDPDGQVLGATTLANTGSQEDVIGYTVMAIGFMTSMASAYAFHNQKIR